MEKISLQAQVPQHRGSPGGYCVPTCMPQAPVHPCTSTGPSPTRGHIRGRRTGPFTVGACRKQHLHSCALHTNRAGRLWLWGRGLSTSHGPLSPSAGFPSPPLRTKPTRLREKVLNTIPRTRLQIFPGAKGVTEGR